MKKYLVIQTGSVLASLVAGLAFPPRLRAADLNVPVNYATIQGAVDAAGDGDTIYISPGVYTEQVTILRKTLTLAGSPGTVMRARKGMTQTLYALGGTPGIALLGIALSDVVVQGITFQGEHLPYSQPDESELVGIYLWGSNGQVSNCTVMGFREDLLGPGKGGTGIKVGNHVNLGTSPVRVQILNNTFADNCASLVCYGAHYQPDLVRVTFTIQDNVITGIGPTHLGTQMGIGIGPSATGEVKRNVIANHSFVGQELEFSFGISAKGNGLASGEYLQPVRYEDNTLKDNQIGILSLLSDGSQFVNNSFLGPAMGYRPYGLVITGQDAQILSNRFLNLPTGILLIGDDPDFGTTLGIAGNATLIGNRFCDVSTPIDIEPLVTDTTNQGTLVCPIPPPVLAIDSVVLLTWPAVETGYVVECATNADGPWVLLGITPTITGNKATVAVKITDAAKFFRLRSL